MIMNNNKFLRSLVIALGFGMIWGACTPMDHYYKEFAKLGDRIYVGKLDSVWLYSGYKRFKLAWENPSDPSVSRVVVYWNANQDSIVQTVDNTLDTGSVLIDGLVEGLLTLNAITYDNKGNRSLATEINTEVYGDRFQESVVRNRVIYSVEIRADSVIVNWFAEFAETLVKTEFKYISPSGNTHTVTIPRDSTRIRIKLADIDLARDVSYRSFFAPKPLVLDLFESDDDHANLLEYPMPD